jgi:hypothetical protein
MITISKYESGKNGIVTIQGYFWGILVDGNIVATTLECPIWAL